MTKKRQFELLLTIICVCVIGVITFLLRLSTLYTVKTPLIPVRQTTDTTQQLSHIILQNDKYAIIKSTNQWDYIQFSNGQTGWIFTNDTLSDQQSNYQNAQAVVPIKASVPVFKDSRSTDKELGKLDMNTTYYKFYERNNWAQIIYNNQLVWVESNNLKEKK